MPSNEYYDSTGAPADNSAGNPATIRAEFDAVEDGFDKLPALAGHANEAIFVNGTGTALTPVTAATARTNIGAEAAANKDVSGGYAGLTALKINMKNVLNTFTSFLTNSNTASRTYTLPDNDGTVALTNDMPLNGRRNYLINGDFDIWQRNTTQTANGYGSSDRWTCDSLGTTFAVSRTTHVLGQTDIPDNPRFYWSDVVTSVGGAGNFHLFGQRIESVLNFSNENARVSFYAKADAPKTVAIEFVQNFGTGGAPSASVTGIGAQKFDITASWVKYEATVAITSIAGKTLGTNDNDYLQFNIWMDAGSDFNARTNTLGQQSGTFAFSHVQIEPGTASTTFEKLPFDVVERLCQRYYQGSPIAPKIQFSSDVTTGLDYIGKADLRITMRAAPSVVLTNVTQNRFPAVVGSATSTQYSVDETRTCNSTGTAGHFSSTAACDAEL